MKNLFFTTIFILSFTSCETFYNTYTRTGLTGTKWKLEGIYDSYSKELKILEPKDCEECFTLTFITDFKAIVRSIDSNTFKLNLLKLNPNAQILKVLICEIWDKDGKPYCDGCGQFLPRVYRAKSYVILKNELIIISADDSYLIFKHILIQ